MEKESINVNVLTNQGFFITILKKKKKRNICAISKMMTFIIFI